MDRCPLLSTWWDRDTHHGHLTENNQCVAKVTTKRYLLILKKEVPVGRISLDHQREFCFADYASCPHYPARRS